MKLNDKYHWDGFIYGLVYPGFVGSMVYELIPATKSDATTDNFFTYANAIKILITLFYCLDYLHLYGDIHTKVKTEKRSWTYLFCDVGSSLFFFFAFVMAKLEHYEIALIFVSIVPLFFTLYKFKNKFDRKFHIKYLIGSLTILFFLLLNLHHTWGLHLIEHSYKALFYFTLLSLLIYTYYVFSYYNNYCEKEDKKIYQ